MDILVVSSFLLIWTMLLWIFVYRFYVYMFPFLLGIYLRGKMMGHVVTPSSLFCISKLCPKPKLSVTSTVFLHCPLRRKLIPHTRIVPLPQYCAFQCAWKLCYSNMAVNLILWLSGKQGQALLSVYPKVASTLPCLQKELCEYFWIDREYKYWCHILNLTKCTWY